MFLLSGYLIEIPPNPQRHFPSVWGVGGGWESMCDVQMVACRAGGALIWVSCSFCLWASGLWKVYNEPFILLNGFDISC